MTKETLGMAAWLKIHRVHDVMKICEDRVFVKYGLTSEQYRVLRVIRNKPAPVNVTDIAFMLVRSQNSVSMIVDRMVKAGLIKRVRDTKDRRVVYVNMTSKGLALFGPADDAGREMVETAMSKVSEVDKEALSALLRKVMLELAA